MKKNTIFLALFVTSSLGKSCQSLLIANWLINNTTINDAIKIGTYNETSI